MLPKIYRCVALLLLTNGPVLLHSMEEKLQTLDTQEQGLEGIETLIVKIKTMQDLKDYIDMHNIVELEQLPEIDAALMASIFSNMTHNSDKKTSEYPILEKDLEYIKKNNPAKFKEFTYYILDLTKKYDGDISVQSRKNKKLEKFRKQFDSTSGEDRVRFNANSLSEAPDEYERFTDALELKELKKEMLRITVKAIKKTIEEKEQTAKRNERIALVGTIGASLITGFATYYSSANRSSCTPCPPPAPIPPVTPISPY